MPPNIHQIANTLIRGEKAITFPLKHRRGFISDNRGNDIIHVLNLPKGSPVTRDSIGDWVVEVLNAAWKKGV